MKKFLITLTILFFAQMGYSFENIIEVPNDKFNSQAEQQSDKQENKTLEAAINFDWLDISLAQRQDQVDFYKNALFESNSSGILLSKDEFKSKFADYKHDKDFKMHYMLTNNGVEEDKDAKYCAFYYKNKTLVMYAIQYKDNPHNAYYYTAFGKLYYVDITSDEYPNYPYTSMQYDRKGRLKSAIYFVSKEFQYMYGPNKEFQGVWYKDKMYDMNGKQVLTRTNW